MEILSTNSVIVDYMPGINWLVVLMVVCFVINVIALIIHIAAGNGGWAFVAIIGIAFSILGAVADYQAGGDPIYTNEYDILCNEAYQYGQDWLKTHNLIEVNGRVWTWQDKLEDSTE